MRPLCDSKFANSKIRKRIMAWLSRFSLALRTDLENDRIADQIKADSRARVAKLAAEGKALEALDENLKLLGIDAADIRAGGERPKLADFELTGPDQPPAP